MRFSLHGTKVPHRKNTADLKPVKMTAPKTVTLPVKMHIGAPAKAVVKAGDKVFVGTLIAEATGAVSAPIHSSVSGEVKKIEPFTSSDGEICDAIIIESDGEMKLDGSIKAPIINSKESLISAIRQSGIVGLGGAGFPTHKKFDVDTDKIEELIINGAECEPYITVDTRTMIDRTEDIKVALSYIKKYLGIKKIIIGIEKNKPKAIASIKALASDDEAITVKVLPSLYPQGGEKVLVYHTTGKVIPVGKLPVDVNCIVSNCTTIADIGKYIKTGIPLVEKCITVDGSSVKNPMNVIVPIGTSLSEVFEFSGGYCCEPKKLIYGGPMMGIAVPNGDVPILKNTNAILAFNEHDSVLTKPQPCIKCGRCINVCPLGINPPALAKALDEHNIAAMKKYGGIACMECGCCSYVCPANRPLVQNHKLIKTELRMEQTNANGGNK